MPELKYDNNEINANSNVEMKFAELDNGQLVYVVDAYKNKGLDKFYCISCRHDKDENGNFLKNELEPIWRHEPYECIYFRHKSEKNKDSKSERSKHLKVYGESVVHKLVKEVVMENKKIYVPPTVYQRYLNKRIIKQGKLIEFIDVYEEKRVDIGDKDYIIPDIIGIFEENGERKELYIEFAFTHKIGVEKKEKIEKKSKNVVEIDLKYLWDKYALDLSKNDENATMVDIKKIVYDFLYNEKEYCNYTKWICNVGLLKFEKVIVDNWIGKKREFKYTNRIVDIDELEKESKVCACPIVNQVSYKKRNGVFGVSTYFGCKGCKYALKIEELDNKNRCVTCAFSENDNRKNVEFDRKFVPFSSNDIANYNGQKFRLAANFLVSIKSKFNDDEIKKIEKFFWDNGIRIKFNNGSFLNGVMYFIKDSCNYSDWTGNSLAWERDIIVLWEKIIGELKNEIPRCMITQNMDVLHKFKKGNLKIVEISGCNIDVKESEIIADGILDGNVEVGTNGYHGGDTGNGGRTYINFECLPFNSNVKYELINHVLVNNKSDKIISRNYSVYGFNFKAGGDWELTSLHGAFSFILNVLKGKNINWLKDKYYYPDSEHDLIVVKNENILNKNIEVFKFGLISMEVEVGTTGFCGNDTVSYICFDNISDDIDCKLLKLSNEVDDNFNYVDGFKIIISGEHELKVFMNGFKLIVDGLGKDIEYMKKF